MSLGNLSQKTIDEITERLWVTQGSLRGISCLFMQGLPEVSFDGDDLYGLGQLLRKLGDDLEALEDVLRCEKNGIANQENLTEQVNSKDCSGEDSTSATEKNDLICRNDSDEGRIRDR